MKPTLCETLLDLGDAVSRNLALAYQPDCFISYGEETITESCLLELHRRHSDIVTIHTFGKKQEALNGADWEWHFRGRARTFKMLVQAKRLRKGASVYHGLLTYQAASAPKPQIEMLIDDANKNNLYPAVCLYSDKSAKRLWKRGWTFSGRVNFEYGCLIGDARLIKYNTHFHAERMTVPWHLIACTSGFKAVEKRRFKLSLPSVDELNGRSTRTELLQGETYSDASIHPSLGPSIERGVKGVIEIDVKELG